MPPQAHQRYKKSLAGLSIGDPVYHPDSVGLRPGHCGYFDDNGRWKHILDLTNIDADNSGYKPLATPVPMASSTGPYRWGPIFGSTVTACGVEQVSNISIPGARATAGWGLKFEKSSDYGAVLMTDPVTYESFPHKEPFHKWCKANAAALLSDETVGREVRERPFFIITEVYASPRCSITYWRGAKKEMRIYVSAEAWSAGKVTGGGRWTKSTNIGTSRCYGSDEDGKGQDKQSYVLFFGGIEYKFSFIRALLSSENPLEVKRRGDRGEYISDPFGICTEKDFYSGKGRTKRLAMPFEVKQPEVAIQDGQKLQNKGL